MFHSKKGRHRAISAAVLAVVTSAALVGCAGGDDPGEADPDAGGGTLTFAANFGPSSLDPALQGVDQVNNFYVNLAYDTLTRIDGNGEVVPGLATSWEYTGDTNTTFELTLREGVKFSDGTDLTSDAVAASLEYAWTEGVNGPNWLSSVTEITAVDEETVQIRTDQPNDSLPSVLSQRLLLGSIISPEGLSDVEQLKGATFGAGPYVLDTTATIVEDTYVYVPNEHYWDPEMIHWDRVVIKVAGNTTSALQAVQNGEADFMAGDATTAAAAENAGLGIATAPFGMTGVNIMDRDGTQVPALADSRVRQALLYAVDRASVSNAVFPGYSAPGLSLFIEGFPGYSDDIDNGLEFDLDRAKELMAEAGYENGFSVQVSTTTANNTNVMAQAVIEQWAELGVTAELTTYTDLGQWTTDILAEQYPITFFNYGALPTFIVAESFFTGGQTQFNAFDTSDDALNELLNEAASAPSPEEADAGYQEVLQWAQLEEAWVGVTYVRDQITIYDVSTVTGFALSPQNPIPDIWDIVPAS